MADTRRAIFTNHVETHAIWYGYIASVYPRLHELLLQGFPCVVTEGDWGTLIGLEGFLSEGPVTPALNSAGPDSCEYRAILCGPYANFATLH